MEFLPLLREIVRSYQAFDNYSAPHIKSMNLTPPQFDVIATLANQPPMTCKTLGDKTLITKGTLTGVLDRLEIKGFIERKSNEKDARSQKIMLTLDGQAIFEQTFPAHMQHLEKAFNQLSPQQMTDLTNALKQLRVSMENLSTS
jgi:MarR family 2-MHQ and catechol resistance regulon transcriptional repressor